MTLEKAPIGSIEVAPKELDNILKKKCSSNRKGLLPVKIWQVSQAYNKKGKGDETPAYQMLHN